LKNVAAGYSSKSGAWKGTQGF